MLVVFAALITTQAAAGEYRLPNPDNKRMAVFEVTAPDGKLWRIEAPSGTSSRVIAETMLARYYQEEAARFEEERAAALKRLDAAPKTEDRLTRGTVKYDVTTPSGDHYVVEGPAGLSTPEVVDLLYSQLAEKEAAAEALEYKKMLDEYYRERPGPNQKTFLERTFGTDKGSEVKYRRCANYAKTLYQERLNEAIADPLSWKLAGHKSPKDMAEASRTIALANCRKWHR